VAQIKVTSKLKNLLGLKFGRLTVLESIYSSKYKHRVWRCACICGNTIDLPTNALDTGRTTSCGCYSKETRQSCNKSHGDSKSNLYRTWAGMRSRCKQNSVHRKHYYDRGITVSNDWEEYINFKRDMENSFNSHIKIFGRKNTSLDRIDTNQGYSKVNCRWATNVEQICNKRSGLKITSYKMLKLFLDELNKAKRLNITLTKEEYITLSYNCRLKMSKL